MKQVCAMGMQKLSPDLKQVLELHWNKYRTPVKEQYGYDLLTEGPSLRHKCQTDGYWLAKEILGYQYFSNCHEELFSSPGKPGFFVLKSPSFKSFKDFAEADTDSHDRLLFLPRGGFKALDLDTEIPTPLGFSTIRDIQAGEQVFGDDGKVCTVVGVSEIFHNRPCYEIEFSTGEKVVADEDHLWVTDARKDRDRSKGRGPSAKTTKEIAGSVLCCAGKERNHRVHLTKPLDLPDKEYTIHPYVLGAWLGDGTSEGAGITIGEIELAQEIAKYEPIYKRTCGGLYAYKIGDGTCNKWNTKSFCARLRKLGLIKNKHIPQEYMRGSYRQRLDLLQGLMDSDGTCDARGHCTFTNKNRALAYQIRELITSLGFKAFDICEYDATLYGRVISRAYQVGFKPYRDQALVFRLVRKSDRQQLPRKTSLSRYRQIVAVRRVESRPTKCLMVDSPNHTYLASRSFIPTHNSTADIVDCCQWFLCWPSIRISILTGTVDLASEFIGIIKGHFTLTEEGNPQTFNEGHLDGKLRLIQILFPEHCEVNPGKKPEWVTPARTSKNVAGPTLRAISLGKNSTGSHCDVLKTDDGTNSENTQNADRITSVNKEISMARKLCEPYGYKDRIGTPYAATDNLTATVKDEELRLKNGQPPLVKVLMHPVGVVKPGFEDLTPDLLQDHMIDLWFPERLTLARLKTEYAEANKTNDTATFYSQFFLDLNKSFETKFRRELMVARTVDSLPQEGFTFEAWDLAYSEKENAKYTVGMAGLFTMQGIYIIGMVRGRFSEFELPGVMATFAHKWKPRRVAVEDSMGARWLNAEIRREQEKLRIHVPFEFVSIGKGSKENSKVVKAKPACRLLGDGRLYFWKSMDGLQELYNELEAFPKGTYTDIVCSLSLLVNHFSNFADTSPVAPVNVSDQMERLRRDVVYGLGQFAPRVIDSTMMAAQGGPQEYDRDPLSEAGLF